MSRPLDLVPGPPNAAALHEGQVLQGLDPCLSNDSDAWPEFTLTSVTVESELNGRLVSLLDADRIQPARMTGVLEIPDWKQNRQCNVVRETHQLTASSCF